MMQLTYRTGPHSRQFVPSEVERMLDNRSTDLTRSEWVSPVVMEPKADGSLCFSVYFRKENSMPI